MAGDPDAPGPVRVLWVFAWLVVGGEETEVRLLAKALDPARIKIDVVACFRRDNMPEQTHQQLEAIGVSVDRHPYGLSFDDTVNYLAGKIPAYDIVVSSQNVADIYPALERLHHRPPLIEHGGLVSEALDGPKHFTTRYVGVCDSIRDAAAGRMDRARHALAIPSMVDLTEFSPADRPAARAAFGAKADAPVIGWVGRLDRKKRVEDFIRAAARVAVVRPQARFVVIGGPDAFMPDYAEALKRLAADLGLTEAMVFLGDRPDVPKLLAGLDVFVWLSRNEGMPHVIAEAGAAGLPVIATPDNGALEQIVDGTSGLFVPHEDPTAVAAAMLRLVDDPVLRRRLGGALRAKVERDYAVAAVVPQWQALFEAVLAERPPAPPPTLFRSFFQGGFESSTHRRGSDGKRLDLIAAVVHDRHAAADYRQLATHGIRTVRDGLRWHLIETAPGRYDWSSALPMLRAARDTGTQVIWDLMHYGWPDDIDIWRPAFVDRFTRFAAAAARLVLEESDGVPFFGPVNEISFFSWGGGDVAYLNPFARGRGHELKVQLARTAIAAMDAIWAVEPRARFVHADPVINVITHPDRPHEHGHAEGHRQAQYQGWDMIAGLSWPQLGGSPKHLDIVGVNYYFNNQWIHGSGPIDVGHGLYRPFRTLLSETYARYGRPIYVAETGIEAERRGPWLAAVASEVRGARAMGVPVEGICLYPVVNHPGWDDDRPCPNGLLGSEVTPSGRLADKPLADELARQNKLMALEPR
ncbi:glycosyltransferase family 4 protein [Lichenihabitans sp. Uapishka_5]|uniref:glycosyltransferase family 4 protein n=1 Tax=Lichenihabitans sp. Uapishka_5 TaxID=3037302 RepID=UPI0029E80A7B|nr:glycosyltransferase family 4 protein [Lichenihabitans sp. Uapishka_5]MDX7951661.1 glycosyltransferase family 4 protein [Lichenihabitans sp. Uapishka_5]